MFKTYSVLMIKKSFITKLNKMLKMVQCKTFGISSLEESRKIYMYVYASLLVKTLEIKQENSLRLLIALLSIGSNLGQKKLLLLSQENNSRKTLKNWPKLNISKLSLNSCLLLSTL